MTMEKIDGAFEKLSLGSRLSCKPGRGVRSRDQVEE